MTETMSERAGFILLAVAGHAAAGAEVVFGSAKIAAPVHWNEQVAGLLLLSAALSAFIAFTERKELRPILIAGQFCIALLVTYPDNASRSAMAALTTFCVFEELLFEPLPRAAVGSAAMLALSLFGIDPVSMWTVRRLPASANGLALAVFAPLFGGSLGFLLRKARENRFAQRELITRLDRAVGRLTDANAGFQEYAAEAERSSAMNERKRIARDIHDTVGYHLMNVIMLMEAGIDIIPKGAEKLKDTLVQTRDQAKEGLQETRRALRALRAIENGKRDGIPAVEELISVFERVTGVAVSREYGNLPTNLPQEEFTLIYRMVQEGLTNSFKHGRATSIALQFWVDDERILRVRLRDNGVGTTETASLGIGLTGMRERVERLRGTLTAGNAPDGFELSAAVPLSRSVP